MSDTPAIRSQAQDNSASTDRNARRPIIGFHGIASVTVCWCAVFSLFAFAGQLHWTIELLCHWRVQYFVALLVAALHFALFRRWRWAAFALFFAGVNACTIVPLYFGGVNPVQTNGPRLRVTLSNVLSESGDPARTVAVLKELRADIYVVEEVGHRWVPLLEPLRQSHPYYFEAPRSDNFGIALYSKYPLSETEKLTLGEAAVPAIRAVASTPLGPITFFAVHTLPPIGGRLAGLRNTQLRDVAQEAARIDTQVILIGDLNATYWSPQYKALVRDSGLVDSARGHGISPTWPTYMPLAYIPIDHALHSRGLAVVSRETGPPTGSDHLPLTLEFANAIVP